MGVLPGNSGDMTKLQSWLLQMSPISIRTELPLAKHFSPFVSQKESTYLKKISLQLWVPNVEDMTWICRKSVWKQGSKGNNEKNSPAEQMPFAAYLNDRNVLNLRFCSQLCLAKTEIVISMATSTWEGVTCKVHFKSKPRFNKLMIMSDCSTWHDPCLLCAFASSA